MVAANKGHIITVASLASFIALGSGADYSATKAAVHSFHEALNQELRYKHKAPNVLTTIVHPNWVRTPLIASFEKELRKAGQVILEPPVVADAIAGAVFGCTGGQVFLPRGMAYVSWLRGAPNWVQEGLRGGLAKITLGYKKETQ
jgi:all-trans-retinol dehydrogenase (NAD+)